MKIDPEERSPLMLLGLFMFIEYVFWTWPFRKLYFEVPEYNLRQFGSALHRLLHIEGRLEEYTFFGNRYWDEYILSISRSTWADHADRILATEGLSSLVAANRAVD